MDSLSWPLLAMFDFWSLSFLGGSRDFSSILYVTTWYFSSARPERLFFFPHSLPLFFSPLSLSDLVNVAQREREEVEVGPPPPPPSSLRPPSTNHHPRSPEWRERERERGGMFLSSFSWKWASEVRAIHFSGPSVGQPAPDNRSRRNGQAAETGNAVFPHLNSIPRLEL